MLEALRRAVRPGGVTVLARRVEERERLVVVALALHKDEDERQRLHRVGDVQDEGEKERTLVVPMPWV